MCVILKLVKVNSIFWKKIVTFPGWSSHPTGWVFVIIYVFENEISRPVFLSWIIWLIASFSDYGNRVRSAPEHLILMF